MIRVAAMERRPLMRVALQGLLDGQPDLVAVGFAADRHGLEPLPYRCDPDVLLLLDGYNDLESFASISAAAVGMAQMVEAAQAQGANVFVATLTPGIPGRQRSPSEPLVGAYNSLVRAVAASHDAALVDLFDLAAATPSAWIGVDGLHPTEEGYARIAEAFLIAIRTRLEQR